MHRRNGPWGEQWRINGASGTLIMMNASIGRVVELFALAFIFAIVFGVLMGLAKTTTTRTTRTIISINLDKTGSWTT